MKLFSRMQLSATERQSAVTACVFSDCTSGKIKTPFFYLLFNLPLCLTVWISNLKALRGSKLCYDNSSQC